MVDTDYDFICTNCGQVFNGEGWPPRRPEQCPVCRAPKSDIMTTKEYEECERANKQDEMKEG